MQAHEVKISGWKREKEGDVPACLVQPIDSEFTKGMLQTSHSSSL